jgi:hypothetical protein
LGPGRARSKDTWYLSHYLVEMVIQPWATFSDH